MKCKGTTKKGIPCGAKAKKGFEFCRAHLPGLESKKPPEKQEQELPPNIFLVENLKKKQRPCPKCEAVPTVRKSKGKDAAYYRCRECDYKFGIVTQAHIDRLKEEKPKESLFSRLLSPVLYHFPE